MKSIRLHVSRGDMVPNLKSQSAREIKIIICHTDKCQSADFSGMIGFNIRFDAIKMGQKVLIHSENLRLLPAAG